MMALVSEGIERVRAFELPYGIRADGSNIRLPRIALVKWRSTWNDKFYQIYVNGRYGGVTLETDQRQMIVQIPTSLETPVRIEVFAVEIDEADTDFTSILDSSIGYTGRVKMTLLREQKLPIGATAQVYSDNGTGEIDYNRPLIDSAMRVWPVWQDKAGFGMSRFGASDFGFDSAAAVGCGRGSFGNGQFGLDADIFEWISESMPTGTYKFAVKITDENGNESNSSQTDQITVIPAARPAEQISICSFDKQTNQLVLSVS
jgi:hypothetical protein